ncbi:hypothetical protein CN367_11585 [Priestia megaterium]|uniref:hypothetical protein n=1 Tax=Priestia megaterium TaxID=1404 RepID=UPI000BFA14D0|nr:hypothetical protein [Priestia megaterium]PEZ47005.1 hypothetical protein CN367_11585 [Priestia megaterium]
MKEYVLTLESGVTMRVTNNDPRSIIGLWIWKTKQQGTQFITFNECTVRVDRIDMIEEAI